MSSAANAERDGDGHRTMATFRAVPRASILRINIVTNAPTLGEKNVMSIASIRLPASHPFPAEITIGTIERPYATTSSGLDIFSNEICTDSTPYELKVLAIFPYMIRKFCS